MHNYSWLSIDRRWSDYKWRGTTQEDIYLSELWMHRLICRTKFNRFLPDNPCRKVELTESQLWMENSTRVLWLWYFGSKKLCLNGSWYLEEGNTTDLEDCRKVTNILKERANTINRRWLEWISGSNPGIEYLLAKWHHGMLSRMMARVVTLGTQDMARLLGDPLRHLGS